MHMRKCLSVHWFQHSEMKLQPIKTQLEQHILKSEKKNNSLGGNLHR